MKRKILFIINSISHGLKGKNVSRLIKMFLDGSQFTHEIAFTKYRGHAAELAIAATSYDIIAAVGGDGTVNEVSRPLIDTSATLAIIPVGSGNGLARHLKIPMGLEGSIRALNQAQSISIDTGLINGLPFLGTAGLGFDACIAHRFPKLSRRGFFSYCKAGLQEYANYRPSLYTIQLNGETIMREAFILTIANSSQYGNNFSVSPAADMEDGFFDLVILRKLPLVNVPELLWHFKRGTLALFKYAEIIPFQTLKILIPHTQAHVDGDPVDLHSPVTVKVQPKTLNILIPRN
ncbi:MAG: YegS/Rv2252/BmrU family lipid kinase [Parachlamydia sp.]|nr:YegS/Rv2252/BmrU family lipid kinase [Parachlamydia sp.]